MNTEELKQKAAQAALAYVKPDNIVGVGTGTTVKYFIESLATIKNKIEGAVASSTATAKLLSDIGINVLDANSVDQIHVYVDGTDEVNSHLQLLKGGGGALTREKILATMSKQFVCIADESKQVKLLGTQPVVIEVIPMARSYIAREMVKLGGFPVYRENYITDNGLQILDVHNLNLVDPTKLEELLNNIPGIVCHGIFARRPADVLLLASSSGVTTTKR